MCYALFHRNHQKWTIQVLQLFSDLIYSNVQWYVHGSVQNKLHTHKSALLKVKVTSNSSVLHIIMLTTQKLLVKSFTSLHWQSGQMLKSEASCILDFSMIGKIKVAWIPEIWMIKTEKLGKIFVFSIYNYEDEFSWWWLTVKDEEDDFTTFI